MKKIEMVSENMAILTGNHKLQIVEVKIVQEYDYYRFYKNLIIVEKNRKYGVIDKMGNQLCPLKYDYISEFEDGVAYVEIENKNGIIDDKGRELIEPAYDVAEEIGSNFFAVGVGDKFAVADRNGNFTEMKYDKVEFFDENSVKVTVDDKIGFVNRNLQEICSKNFIYKV
jgi:hypothetical protein